MAGVDMHCRCVRSPTTRSRGLVVPLRGRQHALAVVAFQQPLVALLRRTTCPLRASRRTTCKMNILALWLDQQALRRAGMLPSRASLVSLLSGVCAETDSRDWRDAAISGDVVLTLSSPSASALLATCP